MSADLDERLSRFLRALTLKEIRPMLLHSESLGPLPAPGSELRLEWKQQFADGDPLSPAPEALVFRPRYELSASFQASPVFRQVTTFIVAFQAQDAATANELRADEELRKVFMEHQLQKTLWPLFRQHVHDGMSRLGMAPVSLPWLL